MCHEYAHRSLLVGIRDTLLTGTLVLVLVTSFPCGLPTPRIGAWVAAHVPLASSADLFPAATVAATPTPLPHWIRGMGAVCLGFRAAPFLGRP